MPPTLNKTVNSEVGANERLHGSSTACMDQRVRALIEHILEHGYVIIPGAFSSEEVREAKEEIERLAASPAVDQSSTRRTKGRNTFEGRRTQRIYGLAGKSRVFDKFALHPDVLAINDYFLDPGYLLNSFQSINIKPGEEPQTLHYDDGYITVPRPHRPFGGAIMVALDAYTPTNGATVIVEKSHTWLDDCIPDPSETVSVIMPSGSIMYFLSTLWHGGGRNTSSKDRVAMTVQYCQPWIRQLENQMLVVDFDKLDEMPPRLVEMLGYKVGAPFIGHVDGSSPRAAVQRMLARYKNSKRDSESRL